MDQCEYLAVISAGIAPVKKLKGQVGQKPIVA
jgi:hypothetical protein